MPGIRTGGEIPPLSRSRAALVRAPDPGHDGTDAILEIVVIPADHLRRNRRSVRISVGR